MTVLSAQSIRQKQPISPFCEQTVHPECGFTYGLGPNTYDVRVKEGFWLIPFFRSHKLASTLEYFNLTPAFCGVVQDKSSWARKWVFVQNTHIDAGFYGWLTLEMTYEGWLPKWIGSGWPIAQIEFKWLDKPTEIPYKGKYQNQQDAPQPSIKEKPR